MYKSITFVLLIYAASLLQVNGNWLSDMQSLKNPRRSLPDEIILNGDTKKCGKELPDAKKCSCQALICDAELSCEHSVGPVAGYRYVIGCHLTKPWDQIDTKDASQGGPGDDCTCDGRAILA